MKTRIKICGITNERDALLAAELGAYALGFIFYEGSKRFVSYDRARDVARQLPPFIVKVGVFVDESWERMAQAREYCMLDRIQTYADHGVIDANVVRPDIVIMSYRIKTERDVEEAKQSAAFPLLDSRSETAYGGTGEKFNWDLLKGFGRPFILAGGIDIGNIDEAIALNPYAIDIASGVERAPGIKDPDKMRALFERVGRFA